MSTNGMKTTGLILQLEQSFMKKKFPPVTCGGKSRWFQAWIRLSMIPSPNSPASTVSVTTNDTLKWVKQHVKVVFLSIISISG